MSNVRQQTPAERKYGQRLKAAAQQAIDEAEQAFLCV